VGPLFIGERKKKKSGCSPRQRRPPIVFPHRKRDLEAPSSSTWLKKEKRKKREGTRSSPRNESSIRRCSKEVCHRPREGKEGTRSRPKPLIFRCPGGKRKREARRLVVWPRGKKKKLVVPRMTGPSLTRLVLPKGREEGVALKLRGKGEERETCRISVGEASIDPTVRKGKERKTNRVFPRLKGKKTGSESLSTLLAP